MSKQLKDMSITFLSELIPPNIKEEVRKNSVNYMMDAGNSLQWNIHQGLENNTGAEIHIINLLPIGSYPQYYKKAFIQRRTFATTSSRDHINVGFCNIKLLRKLTMHFFVYKELLKYYKGEETPKVLIVYSAEAALLRAVSMLKKKYPSLIVCDIIADLPDMSSLTSEKSFAQKKFERYLAKKSYYSMEAVDCFVLLTSAMAEYMHIQKPYIVMEGIAPERAEDAEADCSKSGNEIIIAYTGTLHRRFGVLHLLKAFMLTKNENFRLVICGVGDSEQEIIAAAQQDKRIVFRGQMVREEVLRLQAEAAVLVNPRQNHEEFTKYSFPSKNLEYLSAGKPVIAYKLDGIPDEYDEYLQYPEDDSPEALCRKITQIGEMDVKSRIILGNKAVRFVRSKKNAWVQTKKILSVINDVIEV